jgi:hypothetical protein
MKSKMKIFFVAVFVSFFIIGCDGSDKGKLGYNSKEYLKIYRQQLTSEVFQLQQKIDELSKKLQGVSKK